MTFSINASSRYRTWSMTPAPKVKFHSQKSKSEIQTLIWRCWWGVRDTGDSGGTLAAEGVELIDARAAISARPA